MNIRRTISNWLFKQEYDRLREVINDVSSDWRMLPYLQARQGPMLEMLGEFDQQLYDFLVRQMNDYRLVTDETFNDQFRLSVVKQSRSMYLTDPMVGFAIELWTDYAFGSRPNLTALEADGKTPAVEAQQVWDEFFDATRNAPVLGERKLHKLSETELVDGELFFALFASRIDGETTVRVIPTEQIVGVVCMPDDSSIPLYYHRSYTDGRGNMLDLYYPDWHASADDLAKAQLPAGSILAHTINQATDVKVIHAAFREVGGRGWPLATAGIDWENEYSRFLKNRAAVARAAATWVEKIKAKGGQRAIDMIKQRLGSSIVGGSDSLETNPPPVAGSTWLENDALDRQWMNRPTGAADAEKDGMPLLTQAGLAFKLYPHYLGRGEVYRLATSTAMEGPTLKSFNRYQAFWSSVWRDLFGVVIGYKEQYGSLNAEGVTVQINTDLILDVDPTTLTATAGEVNDAFDRGLLDQASAEAVTRSLISTSLTSIGVQGVDEMLTPQAQGTQPAEAGTTGRPFVVMAESVEDYRSSLRGPVYGLWSGKISRDDWTDQMQVAIDAGLRRAWIEGMEKAGLTEEDMTQEEIIKMSDFILDQYGYLAGFADFIEANSKANGGKLDALQYRLSLWVNAYNKAITAAFMQAEADPLCVWNYGDTIEHCDDCSYALGRVYRKSVWKKWGWEPQSHALNCSGINCRCSLDPVAKGTRANRGHPRRPIGPK